MSKAYELCEEHPDRTLIGNKPQDCNECAVIWEATHAVRGGCMQPYLIRSQKREVKRIRAKLEAAEARLGRMLAEAERRGR